MDSSIIICKIDSQWEFAVWLGKQTAALYQPRGVGWGGRWDGEEDGRERHKGGDICIPMADSC